MLGTFLQVSTNSALTVCALGNVCNPRITSQICAVLFYFKGEIAALDDIDTVPCRLTVNISFIMSCGLSQKNLIGF